MFILYQIYWSTQAKSRRLSFALYDLQAPEKKKKNPLTKKILEKYLKRDFERLMKVQHQV